MFYSAVSFEMPQFSSKRTCAESAAGPNTELSRNGTFWKTAMRDPRIIIDQTDPEEAYQQLKTDPSSVLIDVRTRAEWDQIGLPDLTEIGKETVCIEWVTGPDRVPNAGFLDMFRERLGDTPPGRMFFICRSGARSLAAAQAVADVYGAAASDPVGGPVHCTNVAEGFEGNPSLTTPPGSASGWRKRGLPWRLG